MKLVCMGQRRFLTRYDFFFSNKRNEKEIKGEFSEKKETERHPY